MAGEWFWIPHETAVWVPGKLIRDGLYDTEVGQVSLPGDEEPENVGGPEALDGVNDCCTLSNVTPGAILHTVRKRYAKGDIYTNVGDVLIAVNPFRPLTIYSTEYLELYHRSPDPTLYPPHIFGLCSKAFTSLMEGVSSQSVLISGESGAGKTETTKLVLYFASAALSGQEGGLEDLLMEINPILEAFGNAKTVRNSNSSRFGKWIEVQVNPGTRNLLGVTIVDYLLEVTRVCGQGAGERNYHIFYQLVADEGMREKLRLHDADQAHYLKDNPLKIEGVDDEKEFRSLRRALATLNFLPEEEEAIFEIVASIVHLGNIEFDPKSEQAEISSPAALKHAADLLRVSQDDLSKVICFKRVATGRDVCMSPLDAFKARAARDSVAKLIYSQLFKWLVAKCNEALGEGLNPSAGSCELAASQFLGVLDIAGFESFETNMFEQLLINFSNEKLQQFFNTTVFKSELEEYRAENISFDSITYADNADVLELIEKPGEGLLVILDDATTGVRQTDLSYTEKAIKAREGHPRFITPKFRNKTEFGIRHYAGEVWYTTNGFLEKNASSVPPEVMELMRSSEHEALVEMGAEEESAASKPGAAKKKATVSAMFRRSLNQLMDKLATSTCNFVRCIKPNAAKVPEKFDSVMVMDQLRLCGVLETVQIRKAGFASRQKCADFAYRYLCAVEPEAQKKILLEAGSTKNFTITAEADARKAAAGILEALQAGNSECALGSSKVFLKATLHKDLENRRKDALAPMCERIQRHWRGHVTRREMKEVMEVHRELQRLLEEAGHKIHSKECTPKRLARATISEQGLAKIDAMLTRAAVLPIKLGYLHQATKVRAHIAAESACARQMTELQDSVSIPEMQAAVAHAGNYRIEGPLVDQLNERIEAIKAQLPIRRALQNCMALDSADEVRRIVQEAREAGCGGAGEDRWLLADGREAFEQASKKLLELEEARSRLEEARGRLMQSLKDHMKSLEPKKIHEVLALAASENLQSDIIPKLAERCGMLETQVEVDAALRMCMAYEQADAISQVINRVRSYDLEKEENWLLPKGWDHLSRAKARLAELHMGAVATGMMNRCLERQVGQMLINSFDVPTMHSTIVRAEGIVKENLLDALRKRIQKVEDQQPIRRALLNCAVLDSEDEIKACLQEAKDAGLDVDESWVLPDGPKVHAEARARVQSIKDIRLVKDKIKTAQEVFDFPELEKAVFQAESLGIKPSEYVSATKILTKMQNVHHINGLISGTTNPLAKKNCQIQIDRLTGKLKNEDAGGSLQVIETQIEHLLKSCDTPAMQAMLVRAQRAELKSDRVEDLRKRCSTLLVQAPLHRRLKNVAFMDDLDMITKAVKEAKALSLDTPAHWLFPDGPKVFENASRHMRDLERDKQVELEAVKEIPETVAKLKESLDVPAMKAVLDRARIRRVGGKDVEALRQRVASIETQMPILRSLRNCIVFDREEDVARCVEMAERAGLGKPSGWVLPDGPQSLSKAKRHLEKLQVDHADQSKIQVECISDLRELAASLDTTAMQTVLARATANGIKSEWVEKIQHRAGVLRDQQRLIRDLTNCTVFEDLKEVQAVIDNVRSAGLGAQDGWLWPQGPKLYGQAISRMIFCEKSQALCDKIEKAMRICDVKELESCLMAAQELGLPERKYADANKLFVDLQNSDYVEGRLKAMRRGVNRDPLDLQQIANLVDQLHVLGVKTDSTDMKGVASRMVRDRHLSVFWSKDADELRLARKVFEDLANFSQLRDPMVWGGHHQAGGADPRARSRAMLSFQSDRITEPLTIVSAPGMEKAAIFVFEDLLRCMGDKPCAFMGDKEEPILKFINSDITDEVYVQVLKQLTSNPSADSAFAGWELLKKMVQKGRPSRELCEFLHCFLEAFVRGQTSPHHGAQPPPFLAVPGGQAMSHVNSTATSSAPSRRGSASSIEGERDRHGSADGFSRGRRRAKTRMATAIYKVEQAEKSMEIKRKPREAALAAEVLELLDGPPLEELFAADEKPAA